MLEEKDHCVVVWTSGDREVALNMVFMYTTKTQNSRGGGRLSPSSCGVHQQNY